HLPKSKPQLDTSVYDLVLNERAVLELINSWPSNLFSVRAVTRVVAEDLSRQPNDQILNRCLARLYELSGEHEKTLSILLKLRSCDAFALVRRHRLHSHVAGFSISSIISELSSNSGLLCDYLDAVHLKDPARVEKHADKMVELYADHARQKLLPFLRSSSGFKYELALRCALTGSSRRRPMGRRRDALNLLLDEQQFDRVVVQFCRDEADPELWMAAAEAASDRPRLITTLLENSGSEVDPAILIHKIQPGMVVPGLRNSIVKLLSDYRVGTALTQGCATIQSQDCQNLIHKQIAFARRPMSVSPSSNLCVRCRTPLLVARRMGEARLTPARRTCCCSTAATTSMRSAARAARLPHLLAFALADEGQSWERLLRCLISNAEAPPSSVLRRHAEAELRRSVESLKSEILEACLASWLRPLSAGPDSPELARTLAKPAAAVDCAADGLLPGWRPAGRPALAARLLRLACRFLAAGFRAIDEGEGESGGCCRLLARPLLGGVGGAADCCREHRPHPPAAAAGGRLRSPAAAAAALAVLPAAENKVFQHQCTSGETAHAAVSAEVRLKSSASASVGNISGVEAAAGPLIAALRHRPLRTSSFLAPRNISPGYSDVDRSSRQHQPPALSPPSPVSGGAIADRLQSVRGPDFKSRLVVGEMHETRIARRIGLLTDFLQGLPALYHRAGQCGVGDSAVWLQAESWRGSPSTSAPLAAPDQPLTREVETLHDLEAATHQLALLLTERLPPPHLVASGAFRDRCHGLTALAVASGRPPRAAAGCSALSGSGGCLDWLILATRQQQLHAVA
uniref:ANK_REP_REGION domain-containing protein n=1 Tax=Macrostomum lignano TaxID=282301 RepID=A0A1I8FBF7_9PLAT